MAAWDSSNGSLGFLKKNNYLKFSRRQLEQQTFIFSPANRIRQHRSNPGWSGFSSVLKLVAESSSPCLKFLMANQLQSITKISSNFGKPKTPSCTIRSRRGSTGLGNVPHGWLMKKVCIQLQLPRGSWFKFHTGEQGLSTWMCSTLVGIKIYRYNMVANWGNMILNDIELYYVKSYHVK